MNSIEDNNKMIAEFMDYEKYHEFWVATLSNEDDTCLGRDLLFHRSWDWLMPVVEKIRSVESYDRDKFGTEVVLTGHEVSITSRSYGNKQGHDKQFFKRTFNGFSGIGHSSIDITIFAVVEYIKWYNENK